MTETSPTSTQDERERALHMAAERLGAWCALIGRPAVDGDERLLVDAETAEEHAADIRLVLADRDLWKRRAEEAEGERDALKEPARLWWQVYQDRCEGALIEQTVRDVEVKAAIARALAAETRLREAVTGLESIRDYRISANPLPAETEHDLAILTHVGRLRTLAILALSSISPQGKP